MLCIVAVVGCTLLWVSYSLGLGNIAQENTTADVLVGDQLRPPLDKVTFDQEHENSANQMAELSACRLL